MNNQKMGNKPMTFLFKRAPLFAAAALSLILSAFAALPATSQEVSPEHLALARQYVDLTDHSGIYEAAVVEVGINTLRQLLPQNPDIAEPLSEAIGNVISTYKGRKSELFDQFARVYALTFTPEELQEIVNFYASPTGAKLSKANADLNQSMQRVMGVFENNLQSEFFAKVRAELKAKGIDT